MIDVSEFTRPDTDSTEILQALAKHNNGALLLPDYPLYISQGIIFERPVWLQGKSGRSAIYTMNPVGHMLLFATYGPVRISDLVVGAIVPREEGWAGIEITGEGQNGFNGFSSIERVTVHDHSVLVSLVNVAGFHLRDSYIVNSIHTGLTIDNPLSHDTGDNLIEGCIFDNHRPGTAAIAGHTSGGLRITNNKILSHDYGFVLNFSDVGSTSDIILSDNSIENQLIGCVRFRNEGSKIFENVQIHGNQMVTTGADCIGIETPGPWLSDIDISGNILHTLPGNHQIVLHGGRDIFIHGNNFKGNGDIPVFVGDGASDVVVHGNKGPNGLM
jgi:hypothetical protein